MKNILFLMVAMLIFAGCTSNNNNEEVIIITIDKPNEISASSESKEYSVSLSRDLTGIAEATIHDYNSDFIRDVKLTGSKITFWLQENTNTTRGYREGQIDITANGKMIQSFKVYQARNAECPETLPWCNKNATNTTNQLKERGKEITEYIYNLEKTTHGADTYKNYPAFAYCIEMNHNLPNIEWYLPTTEELSNILEDKGYSYFEDKEFWSNYGSTTIAVAVKFSKNHMQTQSYNYSKQAYRYVHATR